MFSRKIKIITLVSFLAIVFTLFLGPRTTVLAACVGDPDDDCHDCMSSVACNTSKARCTWHDAKAACFEGLEVDWPPAPGGVDLTGESTLLEFIDYIFRWGVLLGGLAAFAILILAGFQYLTSVGDPVKMREAKNRIRDAILGLILLLSTFLILNTLNPELTTLVMPSSDPKGFPPGTFTNVDPKKPCKEVIFFREVNWKKPMAAFFKDPADWMIKIGWPDCEDPGVFCHNIGCIGCIQPCPDPGVNCAFGIVEGACKRIGDAGWFWGLLGTNYTMNSVKIDGACVVTAYTDNWCKDNPSNISASDPDIRSIFTGYKHSIRVTDRTPPSPPEIRNITAPPLGLNAMWDMSPAGTCQVELHGELLDMGGHPYVKVYFRIGTSIDKMMDFPPEGTEWDPPYPDARPMNPPYWNTEEGVQFDDLNAGGVFSYIITGLEAPDPDPAGTGVDYYWTAKACGTQGTCTIADEDPDDINPDEPVEDYPQFNLQIVYPPMGPPQCIATHLPLP